MSPFVTVTELRSLMSSPQPDRELDIQLDHIVAVAAFNVRMCEIITSNGAIYFVKGDRTTVQHLISRANMSSSVFQSV